MRRATRTALARRVSYAKGVTADHCAVAAAARAHVRASAADRRGRAAAVGRPGCRGGGRRAARARRVSSRLDHGVVEARPRACGSGAVRVQGHTLTSARAGETMRAGRRDDTMSASREMTRGCPDDDNEAQAGLQQAWGGAGALARRAAGRAHGWGCAAPFGEEGAAAMQIGHRGSLS